MSTPSLPKTLFSSAPLNPPDSIFGLIEQYNADPNPDKINLSVGVYQDEAGKTPVMQSVLEAEQRLLSAAGSKSYLPIGGSPAYNDLVGRLVLTDAVADNPNLSWATSQTPGGTAALRLAGDMLRRVFDVDTIWMSNPTWANHPQVYKTSGLTIKQYEYLDAENTGLDFQRIIDSLASADPGDAILLHAVCHNPTGVDPTPQQWRELCQQIQEKQLIPVFDFAYQGFGIDLNEDSFPIRHFVETGGEALVCNSFSKNFGLYAERTGAITVITQNADVTDAVRSQIHSTIRTMYSNPPLHGGKIVETILGDTELRSQWVAELAAIRSRILDLRSTFVKTMEELVPGQNFQHINQQRGMFSYSGLTTDQVDRLKSQYAIYALGSGRINIAGINSSNLQPLCHAIAAVL